MDPSRVVSPSTARHVAAKYALLPQVVARLEPAEVGHIFKHAHREHAFFPYWGLFATEFALGYCHNMHYKRPPAAAAPSDVRRQR